MRFIRKVNNLNISVESKFEFKKLSDSLQVEADCLKEFFPYYKQFIEFGVLGAFCIFVIYVFFFLGKDVANPNIIYFLLSLLFIVFILLYILYSKKEENIIFNFSESGISIGTKSKPNLFFIEPLNIEDIYPNVILIEKYRKNFVKGYAIILKCKKPIFLNLKGYKSEFILFDCIYEETYHKVIKDKITLMKKYLNL